MARFDVFRTSSGSLVLDCQSDLLVGVATRLVVPLLPIGAVDRPMTRLMPIFSIDGERLVMMTPLLVGIPKADVGTRIASLAEEQDAIMNAIDMLLSGF